MRRLAQDGGEADVVLILSLIRRAGLIARRNVGEKPTSRAGIR
jgi:hypothetical protein